MGTGQISSISALFLMIVTTALSLTPTCSVKTNSALQQSRILVFSKTTGFRHDSISDGIAAIRQLGQQNNFEVDATEDASLLNTDNLARYQALVFLNTTGDILDGSQQSMVEQYIRNGGGFVGVHSATDTEYNWPWYGGLVGAYFQDHPAIQGARIRIEDGSHPSTITLPKEWNRTDEWYNFRSNPRGRVKVLATLDESTYSGGGMGADHPISWCQLYDGGRSWYTAGGHTKESYADTLFRQHLLGGLQFAAKIKDGACAALTATSAASFRPNTMASESIVSIFGSALSPSTETAASTPLQTTLANTSVRIKDAAGTERLAPLLFVSPTQINFVAPQGISPGAGVFTVVKADSTAPSGVAQIVPVTPALFSANANGQGVAAGLILRVKSGGSSSYEPLAQFDPTQKIWVSLPVDFGPTSDQLYLALFGSGFRFRSDIGAVSLKINGVESDVLFAGAQGSFAGLDQVNARLPRGLAGTGEVTLRLVVDGIEANTTVMSFK